MVRKKSVQNLEVVKKTNIAREFSMHKITTDHEGHSTEKKKKMEESASHVADKFKT